MMDAVKAGGNRQEIHERIRELSMQAGRVVKVEGGENDLLDRIAADPSFHLTREQLQSVMDPARYTGRASSQVTEFLEEHVLPLLDQHREELGVRADINV